MGKDKNHVLVANVIRSPTSHPSFTQAKEWVKGNLNIFASYTILMYINHYKCILYFESNFYNHQGCSERECFKVSSFSLPAGHGQALVNIMEYCAGAE